MKERGERRQERQAAASGNLTERKRHQSRAEMDAEMEGRLQSVGLKVLAILSRADDQSSALLPDGGANSARSTG